MRCLPFARCFSECFVYIQIVATTLSLWKEEPSHQCFPRLLPKLLKPGVGSRFILASDLYFPCCKLMWWFHFKQFIVLHSREWVYNKASRLKILNENFHKEFDIFLLALHYLLLTFGRKGNKILFWSEPPF